MSYILSSVINSIPHFKICCGAVPLPQCLIDSNLAETFSETDLLLKDITRFPMEIFARDSLLKAHEVVWRIYEIFSHNAGIHVFELFFDRFVVSFLLHYVIITPLSYHMQKVSNYGHRRQRRGESRVESRAADGKFRREVLPKIRR